MAQPSTKSAPSLLRRTSLVVQDVNVRGWTNKLQLLSTMRLNMPIHKRKANSSGP